MTATVTARGIEMVTRIGIETYETRRAKKGYETLDPSILFIVQMLSLCPAFR